MVEKLCPGKEVHWAATGRGVSMNDFTVKSRIWLTIICSQVSPCTHITAVEDMQSHMVSCILADITLNIGQCAILDMWNFKNHSGILLLFPSLINELCRRVGVVQYLEDTWVYPNTPIYRLKIRGEGAPGKSKKRKINLGKLTEDVTESCSPSTADPFDEISVDLRAIKKLVAGLPQRSGESSTTRHSYICRFN